MRNLKKVLALVLAMAMSLSLAVTAGAAYKDGDKISAEYDVAVEVASQLGILEGFEDGSYRPQANLTRAQLATMTYRIATGDVEDDYTADFAGGAAENFSDTPATAWYAGYVGYAADAGYLKGMGDGTYAPESAMTGYQALAAFLRTIGYNEPGQFTGADWTVQVALVAKEAGALEGISNVDLNKAISREVAAQMIYNIIFADTVEYTLAFGYQTAPWYKTLAESEFDLYNDKDGEQVITADWGRVATEWYEDVNGDANTAEVLVSIDAKPVASYTTKTSECDIAKDLGLKEDDTVAYEYLNGDKNTSFGGDIEILKTTKNVGAQGRLTEVYEFGNDYVVVMVDQFLAKVVKTTDVKYDVNGHVKTKATLTLDIYAEFNCTDSSKIDTVTLSSDENYTYAKGDMVLVNYDDVAGNGDAKLAKNTTAVVEFVDYADSIVGKQTKITTAASHVINGTEYMDAVQLNIDEAGNETGNKTWFFDTYGNVIGIFDIENVYNYGTISEIYWVDSHNGADGYANATITYMDGKPAAGNVAKIGQSTLAGVEGAATYGSTVSSTKQYNSDYENAALYQIEENDDGELLLTEMVQLDNASVKKNVTAIGDGYYADSATMFLVWNGDDEVYETYTGIRNIPEYMTTANVWVAGAEETGVVDYVFLVNPVEKISDNYVLYFNDDFTSYDWTVENNLPVDYTVYGGYINGEDDAAIVIKAADFESIYAALVAASGKLVYLHVEDGYVTGVEVIGKDAKLVDADADLWADYSGKLGEMNAAGVYAYLSEDATVLFNDTATGASYDIETCTLIGAEDWDDAAGKFLWVVYTVDGDVQTAVTVYASETSLT